MKQQLVALNLADAFLGGSISPKALIARGLKALGGSGISGIDGTSGTNPTKGWRKIKPLPWLPLLVRRLVRHFGSSLRWLDRQTLAQFIADDAGFDAAYKANSTALKIRRYNLSLNRMQPRLVSLTEASTALPVFHNSADLAAWLGLSLKELEWFAGLGAHKTLRANTAFYAHTATTREAPKIGRLQHYHYQWILKRSGGHRLLEIPKSRLRNVQRSLLHRVLALVPVHHAAHGFVPTRSTLTHATPHVGRHLVLRMDLKQFFPSVRASRIHALFAMLGYPAAVAQALTGLCTHRVPRAALTLPSLSWLEAKQYQVPHIPQGAPTSPALANLCAYRLDVRLTALAQAYNAAYTRYADDLVFSGDKRFILRAIAFKRTVEVIIKDEGFVLNADKTKAMRQSQSQKICGVVVNHKPNVPRLDFDNLKATLHNCVRLGASSQNRNGRADFKAHLLGAIAYVSHLNAARGAKLRMLFDRIDWGDGVGSQEDG